MDKYSKSIQPPTDCRKPQEVGLIFTPHSRWGRGLIFALEGEKKKTAEEDFPNSVAHVIVFWPTAIRPNPISSLSRVDTNPYQELIQILIKS